MMPGGGGETHEPPVGARISLSERVRGGKTSREYERPIPSCVIGGENIKREDWPA